MLIVAPIPRQKMLQSVIPSTVRSLKKKVPLSLAQARLIERMRATCREMGEDGRTTSGAVINGVLYPQPGSIQRRSKTDYLEHTKRKWNALFVKAGMPIKCVIEETNAHGHKRAVFFVEDAAAAPSGTSAKDMKAQQPSGTLNASEIGRAFYTAMHRRQPRLTRAVRAASRTVWAFCALVGKEGTVQWGALCQALYPGADDSHGAVRKRLSRSRSEINKMFKLSGLSITFAVDSNHRASDERPLYFWGTAPEEEILSLKNWPGPPRNLVEAKAAHEKLLSLYA